jgi:predicted kinase
MQQVSAVLVVAGPACSGKSTLAKAMAGELSAAVFSQDEVLTEIIPDSDRNLKDRLLSYDEMFKRAQQSYESGNTVILEGTFSRREHRRGLIRAFPDARIVVIELQVPLEVALDRHSQRTDHPAIDHTDEIVEDRNRNFPYSPAVTHIDGTDPADKQLTRALAVVKSGVFHDVEPWKNLGVRTANLGRDL